LWELEILAKAKRFVSEVYLEEPDIIVNIDSSKIAIPCKNIFSEKGVEKVLSNAVSQIERSFDFGIVAINIDGLLPAHAVLRVRTFSELEDKLHLENIKFLARNERYFLKFFSKNRIIAVIVSISIIAEIEEETPQFNNSNQWAIWTVPNLDLKYKKQINDFSMKLACRLYEENS